MSLYGSLSSAEDRGVGGGDGHHTDLGRRAGALIPADWQPEEAAGRPRRA